MDGLTAGCIIHGVDTDGEHRACVVIDVLDKASGYVRLRNLSNLNTYVATYSEQPVCGTWHWIEKT